MNKHYFRDKFLNSEDVNELRVNLSSQDTNSLLNITFDNVKNLPIISKKLLNKNLLDILSNNFGDRDFIFLNVVKIVKNKKEYKKNWHRDSGGKKQITLIKKKENLFLKFGVYLQDNNKKLGGAVDIIKPVSFIFFSDFLERIYYSFKIKFYNNFVNIKSGDLIGFSGLTFHQTTPTKLNHNIQLDDKFSIYFQITNKNLLKEIISLHNKENTSDQLILEDNLEVKNFNNCKFKVCNTKITSIVERIISD
jgi:hypothetical protein